ncbi:addiction module protein [Geothermobacter hydrogeniphilus]|uniref:Addiction module protein n=2 Tax=Geothermobacter hydrogeniphilus TaxID=1969733 RepID=A0A2K2HD57_9BACT|nr:addiction module protein [Geothermobacter hydrogeniphilus]
MAPYTQTHAESRRNQAMRPTEIIKEVKQLQIAEKLAIVETIWDSIAEDNATLPMPEWQKAELDKRIATYRTDPGNLHPATEVHEQLRRDYK